LELVKCPDCKGTDINGMQVHPFFKCRVCGKIFEVKDEKKRPDRLKGETVRHEMCGSLFITVNEDEKGKPYEIFCAGARLGTCRSNLEGIARAVSALLRSDCLDEAIDSVTQIQCGHMERKKGKLSVTKEKDLADIPWSCPDAIARELRRYTKEKK